MHRIAQITKITTLKPRDSDGTKYLPFDVYSFTDGGVYSSYNVAITQGRPKPRKTFTEFEPVTFPTEASA